MKNILVPIDLSVFSKHIVEEAINLTKAIDGKITLLHVVSVDVGFVVGDIGFQYLPELEETSLKEDAKQLHEFQEMVKEHNIPCEGLVKQGIPVDTIIEEAKKLTSEIIVIGSRGHGSLYEALVGSVCHDVIKQATIPVYVIPKKKEK